MSSSLSSLSSAFLDRPRTYRESVRKIHPGTDAAGNTADGIYPGNASQSRHQLSPTRQSTTSGPSQCCIGVAEQRNLTEQLFTCLTTRAVYLDLTQSLSTEDFLMVYRRLISTHRRRVKFLRQRNQCFGAGLISGISSIQLF